VPVALRILLDEEDNDILEEERNEKGEQDRRNLFLIPLNQISPVLNNLRVGCAFPTPV
jgi:hypothetical protein